jgi:hypothetical protein
MYPTKLLNPTRPSAPAQSRFSRGSQLSLFTPIFLFPFYFQKQYLSGGGRTGVCRGDFLVSSFGAFWMDWMNQEGCQANSAVSCDEPNGE